MVNYKYNRAYYKLHFSELDEEAVHVLSFEGEEEISRLFEYRFELISKDAALDPDAILNKPATFTLTRGDEDPIKIYGIISHFEQHGKSPDYTFYHAILVPKFWRLTLNYQSVVFQEKNIEAIVSQILDDAGFSGEDYRFELNESYPDLEYAVQYRETDFNFINRRLEHFGIFYYFDFSGDTDVVVFADSNDSLPQIEQEEDIYYNPSYQQLTSKETISQFIYQQKTVTGKVKLNDYNYRHPSTSLLVENQIDTEAPGVFYDYGDHYKDTNEGEFLARIRNEEILCKSKIYSGKSDCRLLHSGHKFTVGNHYRDDWNTEYILIKVKSRGNQRSLIAYLAPIKEKTVIYENIFDAIPPDHAYRPPRITPIPQIPGIMTARMESGTGDEYAFLDDQGRYKVKVPFDLGDKTNGEASRQIRMSQPYSGPNYGIHFPNHADTEMVWACIDGNMDRPLGLGTVPNPSNTSPSTSTNKQQSVIRTAAQNELTFDDTTGNENIYLHGTKDWTIEIENDKNQTVGNDETLSVGNNRDKSVGTNQSETIGADKTISVGGNHSETVSGSMSQAVSINKSETVGISKETNIGAAYEISVGAIMKETIGATKTEEIGADKVVKIGANSSEEVEANKLEKVAKDKKVEVMGTFTQTVTKEYALKAKTILIEATDEIIIKVGKASIGMKKDGSINVGGKNIDVKGSGEINIEAKKDMILKAKNVKIQ